MNTTISSSFLFLPFSRNKDNERCGERERKRIGRGRNGEKRSIFPPARNPRMVVVSVGDKSDRLGRRKENISCADIPPLSCRGRRRGKGGKFVKEIEEIWTGKGIVIVSIRIA